MNRSKFYDYLRKRESGLFGTSLSVGQVNGTDALLDAGRDLPAPHMAHVLAEVYHETLRGMMPVKETVYPHSKNKAPTDDQVIARLERAWNKGLLPWVKRPYWRDGMFGRGQIQITHYYNYKKGSALVGVDLVHNPSLALELPISAKLAVDGCATGMYTGKKLADYNTPTGYDHYGARDIVNGDKGKNGHKISAYAESFERALKYADWDDVKVNKTASGKTSSPLASLISAILKVFGGKK